MNFRKFTWILYIISLVALVFTFIFRITYKPETEEISYNQVIEYVKENEVSKVNLKQETSEIKITLKNETVCRAIIPSIEEFTTFISDEIKNGSDIEFTVKENKIENIKTLFPALIQIVLSTFLIILTMKLLKNTTGTENFEVSPVESKVRFTDVAGIDEEKAQLEEVVKFLKNPEVYHKNGVRIPRGILLNGAPGTGKTLLAKAVAGEAGVPFFQATGSSFEEQYVGVGASRVRKLFEQAKKVAPCIIFIDEIDSVAQKRYSKNWYACEETLNQLLAEMDGFNTNENVIVMAATNHIDTLDEALIRAGRFDRHVFIPMPDVIAREKILKVHAKNKHFNEEVSLAEIARKTVGFSGADLECVLNEAAIHSINHGIGVITKDDIEESIARVLVGLAKKNSAITDEDKWLTAVHEAGHAIVSRVVRPKVKNFGISIVPRGNAGGYNFFDESNKTYQTKNDLFKQIQVLYGGRIAEELVLGDISIGASSDLEKASKVAYQMVTKFAMNGSLLTKISGEADFNDQMASSQIEEIEKICQNAYAEATMVLEKYEYVLRKLALLLEEKEYLPQEEVEEFMLQVKL